jgi:hypothetical protein
MAGGRSMAFLRSQRTSRRSVRAKPRARGRATHSRVEVTIWAHRGPLAPLGRHREYELTGSSRVRPSAAQDGRRPGLLHAAREQERDRLGPDARWRRSAATVQPWYGRSRAVPLITVRGERAGKQLEDNSADWTFTGRGPGVSPMWLAALHYQVAGTEGRHGSQDCRPGQRTDS